MVVHTMPGAIRVEPPFPIEESVTVDGHSLRIAIEWPVVQQLAGMAHPDPATVRAVLHAKRLEIERTIKAHVFAHGMPLSGELALSLADFRTATP